MEKTIFIFGAIFILSAFTVADTAKWVADNAHTKVGFTTTHMMISDVEGYFKQVSATVTTTSADFSDASAEFTAQVSSIFTDNDQRDGHLKSPDFFDAGKYPVITFKSTSFKKASGNNYTVKGDLTIRGITKPVTLNAFVRMGENPRTKQPTAGFKITGQINRADFGIGSSIPSAVVSETVDLLVNTEFVKE